MNSPEINHDIAVLGGGSAGYACALRAAQLGMSVLLIESDKLGGTCLHRGCIPTKALLHTAEIADSIRTSSKFGIRASLTEVDLPAIHSYRESVVAKLYKGLQALVKSRKITVLKGHGKLVTNGDTTGVAVDGQVYRARNLVLATGSYAKSLPNLHLGGRIITSEDALALATLPESVIVLGGGVIGVEFASIWRSFGAEVTIVEALPRLLPSDDDLSSTQLERAFRRRGIQIHTGVAVESAVQTADSVSVTLSNGESVRSDFLLVAVGRGPNTSGLGFEDALTLDHGFVVTDERLRTGRAGVYAAGDIVAGPQLAHRGFQHGIFIAEDIGGLNPTPSDDSAIPRVTYSDPEVASVGLTEAAARDLYGEVQTVTYDLAGNGKSQILGTAGAVKLVKKGGKDVPGPVVGIHMVGARVGELIGEAQLICSWEASAEDLAPLVHAHPTQNEALGEAHLALAGKPLHVHG
ncbi:dihydrolipoyl dehydrogenase [Mycolicibacterium sp. XJ1819]